MKLQYQIKRGLLFTLIFSLLASYIYVAQAQSLGPGSLDPSFSGDGKVTTTIAQNGFASDVLIQSDGKIIAVGGAFAVGGALVRYNPDGSLDNTFGTGGIVTSGENINGAALLSNGQIVAAVFGGGIPGGVFKLARYNSNGSLDTTFGTGGTTTTAFGNLQSECVVVLVQPDGKIVAAGKDLFDEVFIGTRFFNFALARYNSDGSLDTTFGTGGIVTTDFAQTGDFSDDDIRDVALQPDGKIVAAGRALPVLPAFGSQGGFALARYNSNGSLDTAFGTGGKIISVGPGSIASEVLLQQDGKIVAAGQVNDPSRGQSDFGAVRYNPDGSLDSTFGTGGIALGDININDIGRAAALQQNGKIVVAGRTNGTGVGGDNADFGLVRFNSDGSLDSTFGNGGKVTTNFNNLSDNALGIALQQDGNIVVAGNATIGNTANFAVARYIGDPVTENVLTVTIDIKPGSFPNSINLGSNGNVPVAILSSATFDATTVDPLTVTLAGAAVNLKGNGTPQFSFQDINNDGLLDIVVHVSTEALQLSETDTDAVLTGQTFGGTQITGVDSIRIVP